MGVLWGVLWAPGAVLGKPWGAPRASSGAPGGSLGGPWAFLGGPGRLLGRPCGRPSAPNATPVQVCAFLQWGSWGLPGGPSGRPWECLGGPWGVPGGHGAVLGKPSGVAGASLGVLGAPWEVLGGSWGGPWRLLGQHCGGRSAPNATHSEVSAFHVFRRFFFRMLELSCGFLIFLLFFKILRFSDSSKGHQTLRPCRFPRFLLFAYSLMPIFTFS